MTYFLVTGDYFQPYIVKTKEEAKEQTERCNIFAIDEDGNVAEYIHDKDNFEWMKVKP